jgi:transposase
MENIMKKYIARLTEEERQYLTQMVKKGKGMAHRIKHANILLQIDANGPAWTDAQAAAAFHCHVNTARNVRQRLVEHGLEAALERKKQERPSREKILDGEGEARLESIACGKTPDGRARWTMQLLADRLVELEIIETISRETVRRTLKKTNSSRIFASVG